MALVSGGGSGGGGGAVSSVFTRIGAVAAAAGDYTGVAVGGTADAVAAGAITNAMVNNAAAIAKTKLGSLDIVNADVNAAAAIAKTKLASLDIVNADVNASAAIAQSKLANSIGRAELIYRYTVAGSDKASIDTGADTPDAGSNDWTNGDLLEVWLYARTDEAVTVGTVDWTLNNDGSSIYDRETLVANNTTLAGGTSLAQAKWALNVAGASLSQANYFGATELIIPDFAGTVGNKYGIARAGVIDSTAANTSVGEHALGYRSTSAITRLKVTPTTSLKKFKVGTQLLIYKRLNA